MHLHFSFNVTNSSYNMHFFTPLFIFDFSKVLQVYKLGPILRKFLHIKNSLFYAKKVEKTLSRVKTIAVFIAFVHSVTTKFMMKIANKIVILIVSLYIHASIVHLHCHNKHKSHLIWAEKIKCTIMFSRIIHIFCLIKINLNEFLKQGCFIP